MTEYISPCWPEPSFFARELEGLASVTVCVTMILMTKGMNAISGRS